MKLAFTSLVSNQKLCLRSGSQKRHPDPKKYDKVGQMWKWCWLCFLIGVRNSLWFCTSLPDGEQGMLSEELKSWEGSEVKRPDLWRGKSSCSSMTTLRHIPLFWFMFSNNMRRRSSPASLLARPCTSGLLSHHLAEIRAGRTTAWVCRGD